MKKIVKTAKNTVAAEVVSTDAGAEHSTPVAAPAAATPVATAPVAPPASAPSVVTSMTDGAVKKCTALLGQVLELLGDQDPMDADEVRRATKMRKGGAAVIPKILALCQQHGVTKIGSLTSDEMNAELKRGDALLQVGLSSGRVQKRVRESAMEAHGRSWQIGMTMYKTLQRMAVDDPELAQGLESVEAFFQTKRTKGKVRANKKASSAKKLAKASAAPVAVAPAAPVIAAPAAAVAPLPASTPVAPAPVVNEAEGAPAAPGVASAPAEAPAAAHAAT